MSLTVLLFLIGIVTLFAVHSFPSFCFVLFSLSFFVDCFRYMDKILPTSIKSSDLKTHQMPVKLSMGLVCAVNLGSPC